MEIDRERQAQALAKAKSIIADAEKKREAARVEKNTIIFLQGKFETLFNDEFVENLASYVLNKYITGEKKDAIKVLEKLGKSLCAEDVMIRERSLMVLSVFTEVILDEDFEEFRVVLSRILVEWLKFENEYIAGFEFVCSQLQKIILRMLYAGQWYELENLIIILNRIGTGVIAKSNLIRGMSAKVHENLAEPDILDKLVNVYLDENDERHAVVQSLLIHLGKYAAMFLLQKMIYCNNKEERFALISLIPKIGEVSVPVLTKCLEDEPPWFVIRNVILIISRLDDPALYTIVEPYLTHRDIRVQQQVINCIEMLGGKQVRKRLIKAMMSINDELKGQLIMQLGQFEGMDVGNAFLDLLEQRESFARHVSEDLILKLCMKAKFYPLKRAVVCLTELIRERKERYGEADKIVLAAAISLQAIEIKLKGTDNEIVLPPQPTVVEEAAETPEEEVAEEISEETLFEDTLLFSEDEMERIENLDTIAEEAPQEEPQTAGADDDHEKPYYVSQDHHLMVWSKFYEQMTSDEVNDLFASLKHLSFKANEIIVQQGDQVTDLYLIDRGFAGISHVDERNEIMLTSLQAGEVVGSEGFVRGLNWSVSLRAQTELDVRVLKHEDFLRLIKKFPGLEDKIRYFCNHYDVVPYLINITEDRVHEPVGTGIAVQADGLLSDTDGQPIDNLVNGMLMYIARGGYCFTLPYSHEEDVESILGRQVTSEVMLDEGQKRKCFGVIAGAGRHDQDDQLLYVYVKFYHPLEKADYQCESLEIM